MRFSRTVGLAFVAAFSLLSAAASAATVEVEFVEPERFTDGGGRGGFGDVPAKDVVLREIRSHLEGLGARNLAANQVVKIAVLDIDLAGRRAILGSGTNDVRVYEDLTMPRITLRFALEKDGRAVLSGEDTLSDPLYLRSLQRPAAGDPLRYERPMLTKWFLARIAKREPAGG